MSNNILDQIIQSIISFLGKNTPKDVAIPAESVVLEHSSALIEPITKDDLLMGRDKEYASEYTAEISTNLDKLLPIINKIQQAYGKKFTINSGWRPPSINENTPGAAPASKHTLGLAVDVADADGQVMHWTLSNLGLMKELGVHMEDWRWTPTWNHYQIVPPKSGHRIFIPSTATALAPDRWIGKYPSEYDQVA